MASFRTQAVTNCPVCGEQGVISLSETRDDLFGVPGAWNFRKCRNAKCALLWLDPAMEMEDLGQAYTSYYTHGSEKPMAFIRQCFEEPFRRSVLQSHLGYTMGLSKGVSWGLNQLAKLAPSGRDVYSIEAMFLAPPIRSGRLLDFGCGNGIRLRKMSELGWQCYGLDMDQKAVSVALELGCEAREGGVERISSYALPFEAIFLGHVIEHLPDPGSALKIFLEHLEPGGRLVLLTPNARSMGLWLFGKHWRGLEPPRHLQIFTLSGLAALVRSVGFEVVRHETIFQATRFLMTKSAMLKAHRIKEAPTWRDRLMGIILQAIERIGMLFTSDIGEEILIIAERPFSNLHSTN